MRRSTVIATCLVNSSMFSRLEDAEAAVAQHFREVYPDCDFAAWNRDIDDKVAQDIVRNVGRAMTVNVPNFIRDLGDPRQPS